MSKKTRTGAREDLSRRRPVREKIFEPRMAKNIKELLRKVDQMYEMAPPTWRQARYKVVVSSEGTFRAE